jgi:cellobiose phosphorylase
VRHSSLCIDPVLPPALDGLVARAIVQGRAVALRYRIGTRTHGPRAITCNGRPVKFDREANPYRIGGAVIPIDTLRDGENEIAIEVG